MTIIRTVLLLHVATLIESTAVISVMISVVGIRFLTKKVGGTPKMAL